MFRTTTILFVVAIGLIQGASCQMDRCPYAFAPDGSKYDLSMISNQVHQYVQYNQGYKYTYNISICSAIPAPCSDTAGSLCASPYSTGVCQSWGPSIDQSNCFGSYSNHKIVGLNNGAGVQISYFYGDICGVCNPAGPRSTVITLTCNSYLSNPSKITWTNATVTSPGVPPVSHFNGEFYCPYTYVPYSAPVSSPYSPPSSRNCSNIRAPDGSFYDLSDFMGRVFSAEGYSYLHHSYYNATFTVCGSMYDYCGSCGWGETAVCQRYQFANSPTCWGKFDSTATVQGLNNGEGVVITYDNGDYDSWGNRKTVLRLSCNNWAFPSELYISSTPIVNPNTLLINATIGCYRGYTPVSSPWSLPPWSPPQPSWTPDGYVPNKHVSIQYYGYGSGCNGSDAFMVVVNRTQYCHPGCQVVGNKYIMTVCDDDVYLPRGVTWVEKINYGNDYYCDTPQYATYKKSGQCGGSFDFSYRACDANTVYTYSCTNPYCNQCTLSSKSSTNSCSNSSEYRCVNDFNGRAHPNPLM